MQTKHSNLYYEIARYSVLLIALGFLVFMQFFQDRFFVIEQAPWQQWHQYDTTSTQTLSHESWQTILNHYVVEQPYGKKVNYQAVTKTHRQLLKSYIDGLTTINPLKLNRNEQFAYWVNLYNALVVQLVVEHYPIHSVNDLGAWYEQGPWQHKLISINQQPISLNDIEHRILRPFWQDPRVHYLLHKASIGSPDLAELAVTANNQAYLLDTQARRFIQQEKGVARSGGTLILSRIYEWYLPDFVDFSTLLLHLRLYSNPAMATFIKENSNNVQHQYDWRLNDVQH